MINLSYHLWKYCPFLLTIVLITLQAADFGSHKIELLFPSILLLSACFWATYWPALFSLGSVLWLGIYYDLINGLPVGVSSLLLLFVRHIIRSQRRLILKEPFLSIWLIFSLAIIFYMSFHWAILSALSMFSYPILPWFIHTFATILWYPIIHQFWNTIYTITTRYAA